MDQFLSFPIIWKEEIVIIGKFGCMSCGWHDALAGFSLTERCEVIKNKSLPIWNESTRKPQPSLFGMGACRNVRTALLISMAERLVSQKDSLQVSSLDGHQQKQDFVLRTVLDLSVPSNLTYVPLSIWTTSPFPRENSTQQSGRS